MLASPGWAELWRGTPGDAASIASRYTRSQGSSKEQTRPRHSIFNNISLFCSDLGRHSTHARFPRVGRALARHSGGCRERCEQAHSLPVLALATHNFKGVGYKSITPAPGGSDITPRTSLNPPPEGRWLGSPGCSLQPGECPSPSLRRGSTRWRMIELGFTTQEIPILSMDQ
jgi:hypothetical protein